MREAGGLDQALFESAKQSPASLLRLCCCCWHTRAETFDDGLACCLGKDDGQEEAEHGRHATQMRRLSPRVCLVAERKRRSEIRGKLLGISNVCWLI